MSMWICPTCKKQNEKGLLCAGCGFDLSFHYQGYRTLMPVGRRRMLPAGLLQGEQEPDWDVGPWDLAERLEELILYAKKGFPRAQYELGAFYKGELNRWDLSARGDFWLREAARQGYGAAAELPRAIPVPQAIPPQVIPSPAPATDLDQRYGGVPGIQPEQPTAGSESRIQGEAVRWGRAVAVGDNRLEQCEVSDWKDVTAVSAGRFHTVGLRRDGTVVASGADWAHQCRTVGWSDMTAVSAGGGHTVGLRLKKGSAAAVGDNRYGQCGVQRWKNLVEVSAGEAHVVGLKKDGTVVSAGDNEKGQCEVGKWRDIIAVSAGRYHTVGLRRDGSVVAAGSGWEKQLRGWRDVVAISAGDYHTVGLKRDGSVLAAGDDRSGACRTDGWRDMVAVSAGGNHTVGLRRDGRVAAVGGSEYGQCNVSGWRDIIAISAGGCHTVGIRREG